MALNNIRNKPSDLIQFTPAQLEYLETLFPYIVYNANHTESAMRHYFGAQAVLQAIRNKTNGQRRQTNTQDTIPTPD